MSLDMFLQIMGALVRVATEMAFVRLERHMSPNMGGNVVPLGSSNIAATPSAGQAEVASGLTVNMPLADVLLCYNHS
jgi:hypothetical protein